MDFALNKVGKTGAYISLSCYYYNATPGTPVPLLNGAFGAGFTVRATGSDTIHVTASSPVLAGLTDASLSNWGASTHEAFDSFPVDFAPLAVAVGQGTYVSPDGTVGNPYMIARGVTVLSSIGLAGDAHSSHSLGQTHFFTATATTDTPSVGTPVVGKTVTFTVVGGPNIGLSGTGVTNSAGQATFSYASASAGIDYVRAQFVDSSGRTQSSGNIPVTWLANQAPVANNDSYSTNEDGALLSTTASVLDNDTDVDTAHSSLSAVLVSNPTNGTIVLQGDGKFTYNPAPNYFGTDSFTYKTFDGIAYSSIATLTTTVNPVNDAPSGANKTVTTIEDSVYTFTSADFGFTDPNDSPAHALQTVKITTLPAAGSLTNNGVAVTAGQFISKADIDLGLLKFAPAANANGTSYASFTFQVQDDGGTANGGINLDPTPNAITINVTPVNDAPVVTVGGNTSLNEGDTLVRSGSFTDPDAGDSWTATVDYGDGSGVQTLALNSDKTFALNRPYADNGSYTVSVTVRDGASATGTATFTVAVTNVAPTVSVAADYPDVNQGGTFTGSWSFADPGADVWSATVDYGDGSVPVTIAASPNQAYPLGHVYNVSGTHTITVSVSDGTDTRTASVDVLVYVGGVVTNTSDSGHGSLRQAILDENGHAGLDPISFAILGNGAHTITLLSSLPVISDPTLLDGYTQAGAAANTNGPAVGSNAIVRVQLDGTTAGVGTTGLTITAGASTVRGLAFDGYAVWLKNGDGNFVAGNFIGTDATGMVARPNAGGAPLLVGVPNGAVVVNSSDNRIGGTSYADRNVISGNAGDGIVVQGLYLNVTVAGTRILGNLIETAADGFTALGNASDGVAVQGATETVIGGSDPAAQNVISGNTGTRYQEENGNAGSGIYLGQAADTQILGNRIGTNAAGTAALGNAGNGVTITFSSGTTIGGPGSGNLISGNGGYGGIQVVTSSATTIQGNRIGTDWTGTTSFSAQSVGIITFYGSSGILIGGTGAGEGNLISGHSSAGVDIRAPGVRVEGNRIGTDATGRSRLATEMGCPSATVRPATRLAGRPPGPQISSAATTEESSCTVPR